jgi:hypothetical protein
VIEPGAGRAYAEADWRDALVIVDEGEIELEGTSGGRVRFERGAIIWLAGLPLRALHNPGFEPASLVAVSRARLRGAMADRGSGPYWRRERKSALDKLSDRVQRVVDTPYNLLFRGAAVTDSAKMRLLENGLPGHATILKAPVHGSTVSEEMDRFRVRVELEGREPYEVTIWQSFAAWEVELMQPGAVVECRVDPADSKRLVLLAPLSERRFASAAELIAAGRAARATVKGAEKTDMAAPGSSDPVYMLTLELRADEVPEPWSVTFPQRVPPEAVGLLAPGGELQVAYTAVGDPDAVAVDWAASGAGD